jgi:hypothetical protein
VEDDQQSTHAVVSWGEVGRMSRASKWWWDRGDGGDRHRIKNAEVEEGHPTLGARHKGNISACVRHVGWVFARNPNMHAKYY